MLTLSVIQAQLVPMASQYWLHKQTFNPAAISVDYHKQLTALSTFGFEVERPADQIYIFSYAQQIGDSRHSIGLNFLGQNIMGANKDYSEVQVNYSYTQPLGANTEVRIGVNASQNWTPLNNSSAIYSRLSMGFGAMIIHNKSQLGYSALPVFTIRENGNEIRLTAMNNIYFSTRFSVAETVDLEPHLMCQLLNDNLGAKLALQAYLLNKATVVAGFNTSITNMPDNFIFGGGLQMSEHFRLNYLYRFPINNLINVQFTRHEVGIIYWSSKP